MVLAKMLLQVSPPKSVYPLVDVCATFDAILVKCSYVKYHFDL